MVKMRPERTKCRARFEEVCVRPPVDGFAMRITEPAFLDGFIPRRNCAAAMIRRSRFVTLSR